jgi:hypothetical protein
MSKSDRGMTLINHPRLVMRLRISGAITPSSKLLQGVHRNDFIFVEYLTTCSIPDMTLHIVLKLNASLQRDSRVSFCKF